MRVLVCGGSRFVNGAAVFTVLDRLHAEEGPISVIIHGDMTGADTFAKWWALATKVPHAPFKADWARLGRAGRSRRNTRMLKEGKPDLVVAFVGDNGTAEMVKQAIRVGVPVREIG